MFYLVSSNQKLINVLFPDEVTQSGTGMYQCSSTGGQRLKFWGGREGLFYLSDALTEKSIFFASSCFMCSLCLKLRANGRNNSQHCWSKKVGSWWIVLAEVCKGMQQLPIMLELAAHYAIILIHWSFQLETVLWHIDWSPRRPWVMRMRDTNNVERAAQTNPTLLQYASAITEQKKCWELLT